VPSETFFSKKNDGLSVALDYSSGEFRLALALDGAVVADARAVLPIRRFTASIDILKEAFESIGAEFADARRWTCGTGPGGFTALRASASLVMGLAFRGRCDGSVAARGVPSVAAIGMEASRTRPDAESAAVIYDAKGGGVLRCALERRGGVLSPRLDRDFAARVSGMDDLEPFDAVVALSSEREALEKALPGLDGALWIECFPVADLLEAPGYPWGAGLEEPLYLRPSTDAKPYAWRR
jgi:tRNA A37 threonylcarbamoyladenosine modification protein TsaB